MTKMMDDNFTTHVTDDGVLVTVGRECPWRDEALARLHPLPTDAKKLRELLQPPWKDSTHQLSVTGPREAVCTGRGGRWTGRDWRRMKRFK